MFFFCISVLNCYSSPSQLMLLPIIVHPRGKMASGIATVELGFLEECSSPEQLTSPFYPSKVGGKPSWLDPVHLPSSDQLICKECNKPCILLLQIYAPLSDEPDTYHRSIFVFMCLDTVCHKNHNAKPFRVLRSYLPQDNRYYPTNNETENLKDKETASDDKTNIDSNNISTSPSHVSFSSSHITPSLPPLCHICGCPAPSKCGECHRVHYCSQHHQILDWKKSHKKTCKDLRDGLYNTLAL